MMHLVAAAWDALETSTMVDDMKPILYLDVDGVLLTYKQLLGEPLKCCVGGANHLQVFMDYVLSVFEVRWCTSWAVRGAMGEENLNRLAEWTGLPRDKYWDRVVPSLPWPRNKLDAIAWDDLYPMDGEPRDWAWVEDGLTPEEEEVLATEGMLQHFFYTNVFENPDALVVTMAFLQARFE